MKKSNVSKKKKTLKKAPSLARKLKKEKTIVIFDELSQLTEDQWKELQTKVEKSGAKALWTKLVATPIVGQLVQGTLETFTTVPLMGNPSVEGKGMILIDSSQDSVNHPTHYNTGKIEVVEYIEDQRFDYHTGNAIKYISRAPHKGSEIKDLKKAIWYLNRKIKNLEALNEGKPVARPNETSI